MTSEIQEAKIESDAPRLGRPLMSPEQKLAAATAKKEYGVKWRKANPAKMAANAKRSTSRILSEKRHQCPNCERCFTSPASLKYHLYVSKAHTE